METFQWTLAYINVAMKFKICSKKIFKLNKVELLSTHENFCQKVVLPRNILN